MMMVVVKNCNEPLESADFDRRAVAHLVVPKYDVAVIGAGVSGLQAAQVQELGKS